MTPWPLEGRAPCKVEALEALASISLLSRKTSRVYGERYWALKDGLTLVPEPVFGGGTVRQPACAVAWECPNTRRDYLFVHQMVYDTSLESMCMATQHLPRTHVSKPN